MAFDPQCEHSNRETGNLDLTILRRTLEKGSRTTPFSISVCVNCGDTQFFAEYAQVLTDWMTCKSDEGAPKKASG
jgi:hypothetical protein